MDRRNSTPPGSGLLVVEGDFEAEHRAKGDKALEPGKDHSELSWSIFDQLYDDREGIEADFGGPIVRLWQRGA